jgi:ACDE family multidrug resistance protein
MTDGHVALASPFRQPKGVWAVAFACVVSFMGIGLVDPILPALSRQLKASPSSVELLFTSYLVVTAVAMLVTGWVSSRIGGKRTLVAGLVLIVAFSALAGSSNTISGIIGFRAGWGLGNALFIATSLAVIIGAASGGFSGAIILYETALGIGIALGPLVGGELGGISWRGPFFGVAVLMAISLVATLIWVDATPKPPRRTSILEPLQALRHRGLRIMSLTALGYNWGFFTLLAYTPFPMHLGIHQLGYVFTGWGILVAIFAVFAAPRLQARFGTARTLYVNLALLSLDLVVIAVFTSSQLTLIIAVIVSGAFVGLNNTLTTQAVMLVAPVEKPVASAAYGFVRFIGGGLAPFVASKLAADLNVHVPFYLGAVTVALAIGVLATGHSLLDRAEQRGTEIALPPGETSAPAAGRESVPAVGGESVPAVGGESVPAVGGESVPAVGGESGPAPIVAAIDVGAHRGRVTEAAARIAQLTGAPVEIVHVIETDVAEGQAVDAETPELAGRVLAGSLDELRTAGVTGHGHLLRAVGAHGDIGRRIAGFAADHNARMIVIGPPEGGELTGIFDADLTSQLLRHAPCAVHVVAPDARRVRERIG